MAEGVKTRARVEQQRGIEGVGRRAERAPQLHPRTLEQPVLGVIDEFAERRLLVPAAEIERGLEVVADLLFDVPGERGREHGSRLPQ